MANKLIFKIEFDKQTKDAIKIDTEIDNWRVSSGDFFAEVIDWAIRMCCYDYTSEKLMKNVKTLEHLHKLIVKHGFKLTLKESEKAYRLFIQKHINSITFETGKENKIETLFLQAEDWAQTMLEELNKGNNI